MSSLVSVKQALELIDVSGNVMKKNKQNKWLLKTRKIIVIGFIGLLILCSTHTDKLAYGQDPTLRYGTGVPPSVRTINDRCLRYLVNTQLDDGSWQASRNGAGITGICLMAFMGLHHSP